MIQWELNPCHAKPEKIEFKGVLHDVILRIIKKNNDVRVPEALPTEVSKVHPCPVQNVGPKGSNKDPCKQNQTNIYIYIIHIDFRLRQPYKK